MERAAASCHITMIGDSYVEALQVPIADKFHVRLEDLAARELRHLDVTTSAFGVSLQPRPVTGREPQRAAILRQRVRNGAADVRGGADHQRRFDPAVHGAALPSSAGSTTSKRPSQIRPSPVNWPVRIAAMA